MKGSSIMAGAVGRRLPYRCYQFPWCYPESWMQQYLKVLGSGQRLDIHHMQGHLAPSGQTAFCWQMWTSPQSGSQTLFLTTKSRTVTHITKTTTHLKLGGARNGIHYDIIYFKRPGIQVKKKKKKMLPLVVHFTPQESLQVAGRTRNRRCELRNY